MSTGDRRLGSVAEREGLGGLLGGLFGGGAAPCAGAVSADGIGSMLALNGDGNPLDDILGMAGKLMR